MYNQKLVVALKSAGKVLREFKDTVYVPFGSEYSILIKNLNIVRAQVNVQIDGKEVIEGSALVIDPGKDIDLERFIEDGNMDAGHRFKFIERTSRIESHRGIGIEDGLIRVEFQFERVVPTYPTYPHAMYHHRGDPRYELCGSGDTMRSMSFNSSVAAPDAGCVASTNTVVMQNMVYDSAQVNDAGITVPGSVSEQKFRTVLGFPLETEKHVIVLKLLGETEQGKKVVQAVTVKTKQVCPTCGHKNKANAKFCSQCGTGLEIV